LAAWRQQRPTGNSETLTSPACCRTSRRLMLLNVVNEKLSRLQFCALHPAAAWCDPENVIGHLDIGVAQVLCCLRPIADLCRIASNIPCWEEGVELHGAFSNSSLLVPHISARANELAWKAAAARRRSGPSRGPVFLGGGAGPL
jgi:hypothetical protein